MLFAEWYRICEIPGANDATHAHYILQLNQSGLLKGDETSDRFFRRLTVIFTYSISQTLLIKCLSFYCKLITWLFRNFLSRIAFRLRLWVPPLNLTKLNLYRSLQSISMPN